VSLPFSGNTGVWAESGEQRAQGGELLETGKATRKKLRAYLLQGAFLYRRSL